MSEGYLISNSKGVYVVHIGTLATATEKMLELKEEHFQNTMSYSSATETAQRRNYDVTYFWHIVPIRVV